MIEPHNVFTNKEKNLCEYGGGLGIVLSLTCLVQHTILAIPGPLTNPMIPAYFFMMLSFLLFALKKTVSVVLLIISAALCFIIEFIWMTHFAISLVVLLLFVYHLVVVIVLFMEGLPKKFALKRAAEKADKDAWSDKI